MTFLFKISAQLGEVVDLTVERDPGRLILVSKRLVGCWRQIKHSKPSVSDPAYPPVCPPLANGLSIRTTVAYLWYRGVDVRRLGWIRAAITDDAAHHVMTGCVTVSSADRVRMGTVAAI